MEVYSLPTTAMVEGREVVDQRTTAIPALIRCVELKHSPTSRLVHLLTVAILRSQIQGVLPRVIEATNRVLIANGDLGQYHTRSAVSRAVRDKC